MIALIHEFCYTSNITKKKKDLEIDAENASKFFFLNSF